MLNSVANHSNYCLTLTNKYPLLPLSRIFGFNLIITLKSHSAGARDPRGAEQTRASRPHAQTRPFVTLCGLHERSRYVRVSQLLHRARRREERSHIKLGCSFQHPVDLLPKKNPDGPVVDPATPRPRDREISTRIPQRMGPKRIRSSQPRPRLVRAPVHEAMPPSTTWR